MCEPGKLLPEICFKLSDPRPAASCSHKTTGYFFARSYSGAPKIDTASSRPSNCGTTAPKILRPAILLIASPQPLETKKSQPEQNSIERTCLQLTFSLHACTLENDGALLRFECSAAVFSAAALREARAISLVCSLPIRDLQKEDNLEKLSANIS